MKCPYRPFTLETKLLEETKGLDNVDLARREITFDDCYENKCAAWGWSKEEGKFVCMLCRRGGSG